MLIYYRISSVLNPTLFKKETRINEKILQIKIIEINTNLLGVISKGCTATIITNTQIQTILPTKARIG